MVLNLAEMELDWRLKWFFRPFQMTGMTVEDYYARFRDWKEEMVGLSFSAEEEDYIDGFIANLRWDIRLRVVSKCLFMSRLSDAFYAAKWEESMMFIEENLKEIKANRVFDEMRSQTTVESQKVTKDDSVDEAKPKGDLQLTLVEGDINQDNIDHIRKFTSSQSDESQVDVLEEEAEQVFDEFPGSFPVEQNAGNVEKEADVLPFVDLQSVLRSECEATMNSSINVSTKASFEEVTSIMEVVLGENVIEDDAHQVFDKMSKLTSMKQNDKIGGFKELVLSIVQWPRVLSCRSEVTIVSSCHISSKSMFEGASMFVDVKNHELDVDFWVDGILMFIFDPGGYSSLLMGRNLFEFEYCFIPFQTLYKFDKLPESHTLLVNSSKRKLRYVINWYAASENHHGEKFDYRSPYAISLMETCVEVVGLFVNEEFELRKCLGLTKNDPTIRWLGVASIDSMSALLRLFWYIELAVDGMNGVSKFVDTFSLPPRKVIMDQGFFDDTKSMVLVKYIAEIGSYAKETRFGSKQHFYLDNSSSWSNTNMNQHLESLECGNNYVASYCLYHFQALCTSGVWNPSASGVKPSNLEEMLHCKNLLSHLNTAQSWTTYKSVVGPLHHGVFIVNQWMILQFNDRIKAHQQGEYSYEDFILEFLAGIYNIYYYGAAGKEMEECEKRLLQRYDQEAFAVLRVASTPYRMETEDRFTQFIWSMFACHKSLIGMRRPSNVVIVVTSGKGITVVKLENFVWDPGQCAISVYILEDKDVLKRKGIGVRVVLKQDVWLIGASSNYNAHMRFLACFLVEWKLLLLFITSSKFRIGKSYSSMGSFVILGSLLLTSFDYNCMWINNDYPYAKQPSWIRSKGIGPAILVNAQTLNSVRYINSNSNINGLRMDDFVKETLFKFGYAVVTTLIKEMLRVFNSVWFWKHQWGCRKTFGLVAVDNWENFVWDPGLVWDFSSHHLEDKVVVEGKDMSRYCLLL